MLILDHQDTDVLFQEWDTDENGVLDVGDIMNGMNDLSSKRVSFDEIIISKAFHSVVSSCCSEEAAAGNNSSSSTTSATASNHHNHYHHHRQLMDRNDFLPFVHQLASQLGINVKDLFYLFQITTKSRTLVSSLKHLTKEENDSIRCSNSSSSTNNNACLDRHLYHICRTIPSPEEFTNIFQRKISFLFSSWDTDGDGLVPTGDIITKLKTVCEQQSELLFNEHSIRFLLYDLKNSQQHEGFFHHQKSAINFDEFCYFLCCFASQMGIENNDILALFDAYNSDSARKAFFLPQSQKQRRRRGGGLGLWGLLCSLFYQWRDRRNRPMLLNH